MKAYKDIINYTLIRRLRKNINDVCILFNNLIGDKNIKNRESEFYEVYTNQYKKDLDTLIIIRNNAQQVVDECNKIMLDINTYHIKQYYIDNEELSEYRDQENYLKQEFDKKEEEPPKEEENNKIDEEEDIW